LLSFISPIDLVANYEWMCQTYDPSRPIEDLFRQMQDGWAYAQAGQQPYGKQQIINIAYALVFNTGIYSDACKEWEKYDILENTWENFKAHFATEHRLYRKQTQMAQATGYQSANHAQQNLQDVLMVEQSEALAMLASASAADWTTLSHLVSSNAQVLTNLAEKAAALAAANEIIRNLRAGARTSGGSSTANDTRSVPSATPRARPATNNEKYFWLHGYQIHEDHTSMTCTRRAAGHQEAATKANNMGESQWGRDAVWQPGAASEKYKHIKHYNHCLPYTGYTPNLKHTAIVDSGCTGHYLKVAAPVTNKKLAVTPIHVTLPDGASMQSTHTCEFLLPQLPIAATKAHIIPGLTTSSLLSVGQLVNVNCSVKFDRTSVEVLHNH
jgi:hypothetical protein